MKFLLKYLNLKTMDTIKKLTFLKLLTNSLEIEPCLQPQTFLKFKYQGKFWNPHDKQIPKLTWIFEFDEELTDIFKIED